MHAHSVCICAHIDRPSCLAYNGTKTRNRRIFLVCVALTHFDEAIRDLHSGNVGIAIEQIRFKIILVLLVLRFYLCCDYILIFIQHPFHNESS